MSRFQLILLLFFGVCILVAVMLFATSRGGKTSQTVNLTVWGDLTSYEFSSLTNSVNQSGKSGITFSYVEKSEDTFNEEFTEALAEGKGPDLVIFPLSKLWKVKNKLMIIPAANVPAKDFANLFAEEGEMFQAYTYEAGKTSYAGIYAFPLSIDPLVLYWNRDLFNKAALVQPPVFWDEIYDYAGKLTVKDTAGNISSSAIALGEAKNIPNAKDLLALLMLQAGTPITQLEGDVLRGKLNESFGLPLVPAYAALDFYTQFSNPAKPFYSWNRSLLSAPTAFTSGTLAMYIGYASELPLLKAKNPTLNFGVAPVPQSRVSGKSLTFGNIEGVAVVKNSPNITGAVQGTYILISKDAENSLAAARGVPPARRDLLGTKPQDGRISTFYDAAIQAKGWLDPDEKKTRALFTDMIEAVTSGRARTSEAVTSADNTLTSYGF